MKKAIVLAGGLGLALVGFAAEPSAKAIRWVDGTWDESGAPKGKMLTSQSGWWGDRVKTDVTYEYEKGKAPLRPGDYNERKKCTGTRLFSSVHIYHAALEQWDVHGYETVGRQAPAVGSPKNHPISAIFDFNREMVFNEVDVIARGTSNGVTSISFSSDKKEWTKPQEGTLVAALNRYRFETPARGRYMRIRFVGKEGPSRVNSVIAWGDSADGRDGYEDLPAIDAGNVMKFTNVTAKGVAILPMATPRLGDRFKPGGTTPTGVALRMARDEFETRYFAIVNGSSETATVAIGAPVFGAGVSTEILMGGVVLVKKPPKKLTEWDKYQLVTTNDYLKADTRDGDYGVRPFLPAGSMPGKSNLRRYFANAEQLAGFPNAVPIKPGEGFILMLRMKTETTTVAGLRQGTLTAGDAKLPIALDVVNLTLPPQPWLVTCYANFTPQFPYESRARFVKDVERYRESGNMSIQNLPEPGTKEKMFFDQVTNAVVIAELPLWLPRDLRKQMRQGKFSVTNEEQFAQVAAHLHTWMRRAEATGYPLERIITRTMDEPNPETIASVMACARMMKKAEPKVRVYANPCSCMKGGREATEEEQVIAYRNLIPKGLVFNDIVDVACPSVPIADMADLRPYIFASNHVNTVYWHPANCFSATSAFWFHDIGLNGWRYFAYAELHSPEPFNVLRSAYTHMEYTLAYPLENDVALTAQYEVCRECDEAIRLIKAMELNGDMPRLQALRKKYDGMIDRTFERYATKRPNGPFPTEETGVDYLDFRDELLKKYSTGK